MKPLYNEEEFKNAKEYDKLPLECCQCNKTFYTEKRLIKRALGLSKSDRKHSCKFCSSECFGKSNYSKINVTCENCKKTFEKLPNQIKKYPNHFCSSSCAATYNNKHKTCGNRRSKLEIWIEQNLNTIYPNLKILYNNKEAINSELDVYIPSFKLAFELNGIFHYEPIFGSDKFDKIQNNDERKFQACLEKQIELVLIDVSAQKYFKPKTSEKFLNIITEIINKKLNLHNNSKNVQLHE
jgi:hypothetical protein